MKPRFSKSFRNHTKSIAIHAVTSVFSMFHFFPKIGKPWEKKHPTGWNQKPSKRWFPTVCDFTHALSFVNPSAREEIRPVTLW